MQYAPRKSLEGFYINSTLLFRDFDHRKNVNKPLLLSPEARRPEIGVPASRIKRRWVKSSRIFGSSWHPKITLLAAESQGFR
jgi:hypothetical protein